MICEIALRLLLDGSGSALPGWPIIADAHAEAIRSAPVATMAERGAIVLGVDAFAGTPHEIVPWTRPRSRADLHRIAGIVAGTEPDRDFPTWNGTALGDAVVAATRSFAEAPAAGCERHVVDVATDGETNRGTATINARARATQAGVTINVVALRSEFSPDDLGEWARRVLVTDATDRAPSGFAIEAMGPAAWSHAIRRKLADEIAGLRSPEVIR